MLEKVKSELKKAGIYSNLLMALTSVHHLYGSWIYNSPWRAHVLFLSIPVMIATSLLSRTIQRKDPLQRFLIWPYLTLIFAVSLLLIGVFEGLYNHVLKNVLYFAAVPEHALLKLFPPPTYEMPNDALFEITGMLQGVIAIVLIRLLTRVIRGFTGIAGGGKSTRRRTSVNV